MGSSPAASTKKQGQPLRLSLFFCSKSVCRLGHSCVSNVGSHIPPEDLKVRFQGEGCGYICRRRKSRRHTFFRGSTSRTLSPRGSPTARKYSLLFGGAYAPNDAIYRKRYAFTEIIMPYNFYFARALHEKQLSTVFPSLTRHFDHKDKVICQR